MKFLTLSKNTQKVFARPGGIIFEKIDVFRGANEIT